MSYSSSSQKKYGPVGLIHVDAHGDVSDLMLGEKIAHGTPFRRSYDEALIDPKKVVQIGLRGSQFETGGGQAWAREHVSTEITKFAYSLFNLYRTVVEKSKIN